MEDIIFPGLGITFKNLKDGFTIFGVEIKFYGVLIGIGFMLAILLIAKEAKRTNQDPDLYYDFLLWMVIPAILGARLYYVIFRWDEYFVSGRGIGETLLDVINIRQGGLAIYGGVIAGVIVACVFCKKKKVNFLLMADTVAMGLLVGQIIGRFGNFFNREVFGTYTDSIFRMCIPTDYFVNEGSLSGLVSSGIINNEILNNTVVSNGMNCISVHPTFLYEALWNLGLLIVIFLYRKHKKFDGELGLLYLWGYGLGRVWIEGVRTDTLMLPFGNIKVSQLLAAICVVVASLIIVKKRVDYAKKLINSNEEKEDKVSKPKDKDI